MFDSDKPAYYLQRARQEREKGQLAHDECAKLRHEEMAKLYEKRAELAFIRSVEHPNG